MTAYNKIKPTIKLAILSLFSTSIVPQFANAQDHEPLSTEQNLIVGKSYTVGGKTYSPKHDPNYDTAGTASWYGAKFHGKPTASGETFDRFALTAAHKTLPFNSMVSVTNLETGQTVVVRINDRGPFVGNHEIDLSEAAAKAVGLKQTGTVRVSVVANKPAAMPVPIPPSPSAKKYMNGDPVIIISGKLHAA